MRGLDGEGHERPLRRGLLLRLVLVRVLRRHRADGLERGECVDAPPAHQRRAAAGDGVDGLHEDIPNRHAEVGLGRQEQRRHARHAGGRHGRAVHVGPARARHRRHDVLAGSGEIDLTVAVVGEAREPVAAVGGGHRHDVADVVVGGIGRDAVVVDALVARGGHERHAPRPRVVDRVAQGRRVARARPRRVDHLRAVVHRVVDRRRGVVGRSAAVALQKLQRHHPRAERRADDPVPVVAPRGDGARHVGPVPVEVVRVPVPADEVPAVHVIHVAVAVVVDVVPGDLTGVGPEPGGEIRVGDVQPRVDHRDDHPLAGGHVPGGESVDVGAHDAAVQARVLEAPEVLAVVVGRAFHVVQEVRLGEVHHRGGLQFSEQLRLAPGLGRRQQGGAIQPAVAQERHAQVAREGTDRPLGAVLGDPHDELSLDPVGRTLVRFDLVAAGEEEQGEAKGETRGH